MLFCWDAVVETKKVLDAVEYIMFFDFFSITYIARRPPKEAQTFPILPAHAEKNVDF